MKQIVTFAVVLALIFTGCNPDREATAVANHFKKAASQIVNEVRSYRTVVQPARHYELMLTFDSPWPKSGKRVLTLDEFRREGLEGVHIAQAEHVLHAHVLMLSQEALHVDQILTGQFSLKDSNNHVIQSSEELEFFGGAKSVLANRVNLSEKIFVIDINHFKPGSYVLVAELFDHTTQQQVVLQWALKVLDKEEFRSQLKAASYKSSVALKNLEFHIVTAQDAASVQALAVPETIDSMRQKLDVLNQTTLELGKPAYFSLVSRLFPEHWNSQFTPFASFFVIDVKGDIAVKMKDLNLLAGLPKRPGDFLLSPQIMEVPGSVLSKPGEYLFIVDVKEPLLGAPIRLGKRITIQ